MENLTEPSSSISFTSSSLISNASTGYTLTEPSVSQTGCNLEIVSLNKLSASLEQLLVDSTSDYSDADIVVEDIPVGIHRCILAARSEFFNELFKRRIDGLVEKKGCKPIYCIGDLLPYGNVGYEAFLIILSYMYTGKLKPSPPEVSTCVDDGCAHDACRPAIDFSVELMYASVIFQIPELISLFQRRLFNFVEKILVEDVIPIILVSFHCQSTQLLNQCVHRVARSDLNNVCLEKELPFEVAKDIKLLRIQLQVDSHAMIPEDLLREKRIRRMHKALDSDDVELVKLLLTESDVTLDEADALHYAAAYCDAKVVSQVLSLDMADVNLRNARGYTVLHVAALRKEPSIIVPLLSKGACALDATLDGRSALSICKRLTKPKDYHAKTEQGQKSNKDRICINVLEQEVHRNPMAGNSSRSSSTISDDLYMKLLCLENREMSTDDLSQQFHFERNKFQEGEVFVGFHMEASNLLQRLASIPKKQLEVISIVGMAGLGKTTLARRLYNDPYVVSYFHVRAWVTCSHVYRRRDLLLDILRSVIEITDEVYKMNDLMLSHALYRALERHRYLIVIDDIWSNEPWDDFSICFPDVNNGSRIMLTTRFKHVALHAQFGGDPLSLRFLTEEESFDLFMSKVFKDGDFIGNLRLIAKNITRKCRGLPLAIVVIAGLLKSNLEKDWWAQVEESVSSYIVTDQNQYMDTLALSYNNLPQHLRPCFLYFGAFPEDHDIPVRKLISLWTAEGFIHQDDTKDSLEDVAKVYLMDLIGRSLVVVGKKGSNGAIKTCRIHDFLRDLCLRKAAEEKFSPDIYKYNKHYFSCPHSLTNPSTTSQLLLSPDVLTTPSNCSCYSSEVFTSFFKDIPILWNSSKYIRTLDISSIELFLFPSEIVQLLHLRYLELRFRCGNPPESICHLRELQTLVMSSRMNMVVPESMWKLVNLKHLCINSGENLVNISTVEEPSLLENMQTMSLVSPTKCQNILNRTPNLQNLGLCGPLTTKSGDLICPDLSLLMHLEKLKLLNTSPLCKVGSLSTSIIFPESLKNLTMSSTYLDWKESWIFEMMPNLETLKLKLHAFVGENWKSCPDAFPRLKFLKLDELDIVTWTASCDDFPVLQRLQVYMCPYLMEIPEDFGYICTLEWIELSGCSDAAAKSVTDIKKEQESYGDDWLKILLKPGPTKRKHKVAAH